MDSHQPGHSAEKRVGPAVLVIRADASTAIGSGHVMRCLALAQAWQDQGGAVTFVSDVSISMRQRLEAEGIEVRSVTGEPGSVTDAEHLIETARELGARHVMVDGYHFGAAYQKRLKDTRLRVLFVDDNGHAAHYSADLVLNQNIHASEDFYSRRETYTRLLLGTRYALLRREFQAWRDWQRAIPDVARKVLVTMGGSDPDNVTLKVLRALEHMPLGTLDVRVVVGGGNPHFAELERVAQRSPQAVHLEQNVTDMPALMAWADVAVSAAGSTCWELAFMGLPSILLVLADNQRAIAEHLAKRDAAVSIGWHAEASVVAIANALTQLLHDFGARQEIARRGRTIVDGHGGARVVAALRQARLHLRPVEMRDRELLWRWANDPAVRQSAFNTAPIDWEEHALWFDKKQADPDCFHFIAHDRDGRPVGQIRFDRVTTQGREFEVDVSISSEWRGSGYGAQIIWQGIQLLSQLTSVRVLHARIRSENTTSIQTFRNAGFSPLRARQLTETSIQHFIWRRKDD